MYNPYQMQPQCPPSMSPFAPYGNFPGKQASQGTPIDGVRWVNSVDEVNATTIGFGQSALFMFSGENAFAIKSVDGTGVPTVKVFDFTERPPASNPVVLDPSQYVTKDEFENLRRMYEQLAQHDIAAASATADAQQSQAPQLPLSPQQAREQFCNQVAAMGWTSSQLNQFLDQVEQQARSLGIR